MSDICQQSKSMFPIQHQCWGTSLYFRQKHFHHIGLDTVHNVINYYFSKFIWTTERQIPSSLGLSPKLTSSLEFVDDFLFFDPSVLKPDCHLSLWQISLCRYPSSFILCDEFICGILLFQFLELYLGVWHAFLPPTANRMNIPSGYRVCKEVDFSWHYYLCVIGLLIILVHIYVYSQ